MVRIILNYVIVKRLMFCLLKLGFDAFREKGSDFYQDALILYSL